jgi:hypothetical protein
MYYTWLSGSSFESLSSYSKHAYRNKHKLLKAMFWLIRERRLIREVELVALLKLTCPLLYTKVKDRHNSGIIEQRFFLIHLWVLKFFCVCASAISGIK